MKTILIVDDEPAILDLLTTLLCEEGYQVLSAADGAAALKGLNRQPVDVVITDGMMPRLAGLIVPLAAAATGGVVGHNKREDVIQQA